MLCYYTVFNVEQCDGLTLPEIEEPTAKGEIEKDENCESIVTGWANGPALHLTSKIEHRATTVRAAILFTCPHGRASLMLPTITARYFMN